MYIINGFLEFIRPNDALRRSQYLSAIQLSSPAKELIFAPNAAGYEKFKRWHGRFIQTDANLSRLDAVQKLYLLWGLDGADVVHIQAQSSMELSFDEFKEQQHHKYLTLLESPCWPIIYYLQSLPGINTLWANACNEGAPYAFGLPKKRNIPP